MKRWLTCVMCAIIVLAQLPIALIADTGNFLPMEYPQLEESSFTQYDNFSIACDPSEMIYGIPTAEYQDTVYGFSNGKLYAVTDKAMRVVAEGDGDNINIVNSSIYFTTYSDGKAEIKRFDIETERVSTVMYAGKDMIHNLYVVNEKLLMYLSGGVVFQASLEAGSSKVISPVEDICSFIPTNYGNLYATGESCASTLYLEEIKLLDNVQYYSADRGYLVVKIKEINYQIKLSKLRSFYEMKKENSSRKCLDLSQYLEEYSLDGVYSVADLLGDEDLPCGYCEGYEEESENTEPKVMFSRMRDMVEEKGIIDTTNHQRMILTLADRLLNFSFKPLRNVPKHGGGTFTAGQTYKGIPYSRGGFFTGTAYSGQHKKIAIIGKYTNGEYAPSPFTLSDFADEVAKSSSKLYTAASGCNVQCPLYGTDCSSFVSYCWGIPNMGTGNLPDHSHSSAIAINSLSKLTQLSFGDAMIKQGVQNVSSGHALLIYKVTYNSYGSVSKITIAEETGAITVKHEYTAQQFYDKYKSSTGYYAYISPHYTVRFNGNGGTPSKTRITAIANVNLGLGSSMPTATRTGYTFAGWSEEIGGEATDNVIRDTTLYARWISETVASIPVDEIIICENDMHRIMKFLNEEKER